MRFARSLLWPVLALVTCLLLPLALVATWTSSVVTDTDEYVEAVGPLADDRVAQQAVEQRLQAAVREQVPQLPADTVRAAVVRVVEGPEFRPAWEAANRSAHEQLVATLEAGGDSPVDDAGRVSVELGTLLVAVLDTLDQGDRIDPSALPPVRTEFALVSAEDLEQAREGYRVVDAAGLLVPIALVMALALTLMVAVRRRRALVWLGLGSAALCGVLLWLLVEARDQAVARTARSEAELVGAVYDVVVRGLRDGTWLALGVSLVVLLGSLALGLVAGRPRSART
jgi:hypothetical protein